MENVAKTTACTSFSEREQEVNKKLPGLYCELTKIRLSVLVVVTTAVGFIMVSPAAIERLPLGRGLCCVRCILESRERSMT